MKVRELDLLEAHPLRHLHTRQFLLIEKGWRSLLTFRLIYRVAVDTILALTLL